MSSAQRRHPAGVIDDLLERPRSYELLQAVRLLERWLSSPTGQRGSGLKRLAFRNSMALSFPVGDIEELTLRRAVESSELGHGSPRPEAVEQIEITSPALSLLGASGALPLYYTEALLQYQQQYRDDSARAFMDVFSHRAVTLFYEAWRKNRLALQYERDRNHAFLPLLLSLSGLGAAGARRQWANGRGEARASTRRDAELPLAFHAGQLQQRTVSAGQLRQLLSAQFRVPVTVDQFVGAWYTLPEAARFHLGDRGGAGMSAPSGGMGAMGAMGVLGRSAMLGERMWQRDLLVRLVIGPVRLPQFRRFLPGGAGAQALKQLLLLLTGTSLAYEIKLTLDRRDVQPVTLHAGRAADQGRLGWDTFLTTKPSSQERDDVRYTIDFAQ